MENKSRSVKKEIALLQNTALKSSPFPWTPSDKARLAEALGSVCALQRQYGKSPSELETMVEGFAWVMQPYAIDTVIGGIAIYMRENMTIPTPYEIRQIIDPMPVKFKPNPSYYVKLQQIFKAEGPYGLNDEEIEYIRRYEEHMLRESKEAI